MLRPIQPYIEYVLNQDYIAEFLCINKNKPQLQCEGKCHLAKQIKKQQENNPFTSLSISLEHYPIGFVHILRIDGLKHLSPSKENHFRYNKHYTFDYLENTFQPPELS